MKGMDATILPTMVSCPTVLAVMTPLTGSRLTMSSSLLLTMNSLSSPQIFRADQTKR